MASRSIARAEGFAFRAWFRVATIAILLLACLPLHGAWRLLGLRSPWPRAFLRGAARAAGAKVTVTGAPLTRDVLYIANHLSWLDILALAGPTGTAFVAKADMAPWPVIGWLATLNNSVYVSREARLDAGAQAGLLRAALETHQPLAIFPEGTTGDGVALLPFRSSLLAAVAPPPDSVAIQPVAIDYGPAAAGIAWTGDESVGHNAMRVMRRPGRLAVTLNFLDPLPPAGLSDRKAITAQARAAIAAALGQSQGLSS
ncbi:MAG: 1-acyl-sn-glycerol-3-phosphate acyltransferase [Sphingomonadaceae bacterium]|nr:1-acyl-sn-glycerol-3-phosphate acyltransferase [Sphingomonadaceae bacterium]